MTGIELVNRKTFVWIIAAWLCGLSPGNHDWVVAGVAPQPAIVTGPQEVLSLPADQAYAVAMKLWAEGRQSDAENLLSELVDAHPTDQRLAFFQVACNRSRFDVSGSVRPFSNVMTMDPNSPAGKCAALMVLLDTKTDVARQFDSLAKLAKDEWNDPLIVWMAAVQCRSLNRNKEGVQYYRRLLELIAPAPGPVLLHQTFANLLDELKLYDEALTHRKLAVQLEPASWSYQGLGNTLASLKRYDEAGEAFARASELAPGTSLYLRNWSDSLRNAGKYEQSIEKSKRATELNPRDWAAWNSWGLSLEQLGQVDEALEKFRRVREIAPRETYGYRNAARVLRSVGRASEAAELDKQFRAATAPADGD
jgi:tetratricopeptide (TPR) repeat protein